MENRRYYYHCDRLGMLVWQDQPSADEDGPRTRTHLSPPHWTRLSKVPGVCHASVVCEFECVEGGGGQTSGGRWVSEEGGGGEGRFAEVVVGHSQQAPGVGSVSLRMLLFLLLHLLLLLLLPLLLLTLLPPLKLLPLLLVVLSVWACACICVPGPARGGAVGGPGARALHGRARGHGRRLGGPPLHRGLGALQRGLGPAPHRRGTAAAAAAATATAAAATAATGLRRRWPPPSYAHWRLAPTPPPLSLVAPLMQ